LSEPGRSPRVHDSAIVDPTAELASGVEIGPWALVGPGVVVGEATVVGPRVLIERDTTIGKGCRLHNGCVLGTDPQDLKYRGEETALSIGDRTVVREFATLNRGTAAAGRTVVGDDCLIMAYAHVAHDCLLGNRVILANSVAMGGHVEIGDWAVVGGLTPIHQFVRIGTHAFVGGGSRIAQDVPPYCRVAGNPPKLFGINRIGLERRGVPADVRRALKAAYRAIFYTTEPLTKAVDAAALEFTGLTEVQSLIEFIRASGRGITT